jgi:hypothetical protein
MKAALKFSSRLFLRLGFCYLDLGKDERADRTFNPRQGDRRYIRKGKTYRARYGTNAYVI